jgi:hypothetical protein
MKVFIGISIFFGFINLAQAAICQSGDLKIITEYVTTGNYEGTRLYLDVFFIKNNQTYMSLCTSAPTAAHYIPKVNSGNYGFEIFEQFGGETITKMAWKYGSFPRDVRFHDEIYLTMADGRVEVISCE